MHSDPPPPGNSAAADPANGFDALLVSARLLQRAAGVESRRRLLHGKNLGLVCESEGDPAAILFRSAALALGASVSHIRPDLSLPAESSGTGLLATARVLGRLYDGIECQGLAPAMVRQLGREAGVPVFDGVACSGHPTARLVQQLGGADSPEEKRRWILQAALLAALR